MGFGYISEIELDRYISINRKIIVVKNVTCADIEEYNNNCLVTLSNEGFNINLLTKVRLRKTRGKKSVDFIYLVRKEVDIKEINLAALNNWAIKMGNIELHGF